MFSTGKVFWSKLEKSSGTKWKIILKGHLCASKFHNFALLFKIISIDDQGLHLGGARFYNWLAKLPKTGND